MDMSEKNGQPSMEEILASIRRIIAEEPGDALHADPLRSGSGGIGHEGLDEAGEFELPSMFRGAAASGSDKASSAPLLGRLTDAIRSASQPGSGDAAASASPDAPFASQTVPQQPAASPGLSSLKPVRQETPMAAPAWTQPAPEAAPQAGPAFAASFPVPPAASSPAIKREMVAFKDTRFSRMTTLGSAAAPPPVAAPAPVSPQAMVPRAANVAPAAPQARPAQPQPEAQNVAPGDQSGSGAIEDTTAELLRPMLRLWLSENMPRMVEKALHIEVAESVKLGAKTTKLQ